MTCQLPFYLTKLRKHSRNGESQGNLNIRSYKDKKLCARA